MLRQGDYMSMVESQKPEQQLSQTTFQAIQELRLPRVQNPVWSRPKYSKMVARVETQSRRLLVGVKCPEHSSLPC